jgi:hypothetical protein
MTLDALGPGSAALLFAARSERRENVILAALEFADGGILHTLHLEFACFLSLSHEILPEN